MKHIISFSGGKDSTAMLIRMLELNMEIDKIVFADTLFEFPELYVYIDKIEKFINRPITRLKPNKELWNKWFKGKITRGKLKGEVRGLPRVLFPCYWSRESKIKPLTKIQGKDNISYIGIAYDEQKRISNNKNIRYPLNEWKWTEQDCIDYLNKKNLFNPLYVNFKRLGCWWCPKQSEASLFVLYKNYPELLDLMLVMESTNKKLTGRDLRLKPLSESIKNFKKGIIPKQKIKYDCWNGCESVKKAFLENKFK